MLSKAAALVLFPALLLTTAHRVEACTCAWTGPFVRMADSADLVIRGIVRAYGQGERLPLTMEIEVVEVLKGRVRGQRVIVWGDNGAQCRPYVTAFPLGTEWIFALQRDRQVSRGEYVLWICGEYWLKVSGANAVGQVTEGNPGGKPQTITLDRLREILRMRRARQTTTRTWSSVFLGICGTTASGAG